jgi:hypothetical protein
MRRRGEEKADRVRREDAGESEDDAKGFREEFAVDRQEGKVNNQHVKDKE